MNRIHLDIGLPERDMLREVFREAYGLSGPMLSVEELPWGRTNRTYKISIPSDTYILQRLPEGPTDDCKQERAIERFADVRGELARRGSAIMLPEFVTDVRGATVTDFRGDRYVLQRYMPNTWHPLLTPERARSAGRLMGRLRRDLSGWEPPASRWEEDALDMRDSLVRKHEYLLMTLARSARDPWYAEVERLRDMLAEAVRYCALELVPLLPPAAWAIHSDAKLSNMIFHGDEATWFVDVYSFRVWPYAWELGQTMRSFASKGVPRGYSAPVLAATAQGYAEVLAPDEQLTLRQALAAGAVRTVWSLLRFAVEMLSKRDRPGVPRTVEEARRDFAACSVALRGFRAHLEDMTPARR